MLGRATAFAEIVEYPRLRLLQGAHRFKPGWQNDLFGSCYQIAGSRERLAAYFHSERGAARTISAL